MSKRKEQEHIDKTCSKIKKIESEHYQNLEIGKERYYDTSLDWYDQSQHQKRYNNAKQYLDEFIEPIIDQPFIGRIDFVSVDGVTDVSYIGRRAYNKADVVIHDWRSDKGEAFRSKRIYHEGLNILLNRTLSIRKSTLMDYFDNIVRNKKSSVDDMSKAFQTLIEQNKLNNDILTSLEEVQNRIIDLPIDSNVVLHGVPGSGKTAIGGYRLSSIAFKLNPAVNDNFRLLYVTSNDSLRSHTISFFNAIDTEYIDFITTQDIFQFSRVISHNFGGKFKSVIYGKNRSKGELTQSIDNFSGDQVEIITANGFKIWHPKDDITFYKNEWNPYAKKIFGKNPIKKVRKFEGHKKSDELFRLMNDPSFEEAINKKFERFADFSNMSIKDLREFVSEQMSIDLRNNDLIYLSNFIKFFILVRNETSLQKQHVKAIFLDEAQDYTYLDIRLFQALYPRASLTLCGDINQSNGRDPVQEDWATFEKTLSTSVKIFNVCFRSSKKIVETFNRRASSNKYGEAVSIVKAEGIVQVIKDFNELIESSNILSEETCLVFLNNSTGEMLKKYTNHNVSVLSAYEVKGLEFKNVVLFDLEEIKENSQGQKFRYMLISRALDSLYVVDNTS